MDMPGNHSSAHDSPQILFITHVVIQYVLILFTNFTLSDKSGTDHRKEPKVYPGEYTP